MAPKTATKAKAAHGSYQDMITDAIINVSLDARA